MQWYPTVAFSVLTTISFLPAVFVTLLLWHFDALQEGGPLIFVLLVPTLAWCGSRYMKCGQNRTNADQNGPEADSPPKYEKVMSEPPPYEVLFVGMPFATTSSMCSSLRSTALNFSREGPRSCFSFTENCSPGSCWPVPGASLVAPNEVFTSITMVERDGLVDQVSKERTSEGIKSAANDESAQSESEDCTTDSPGDPLSNKGSEDDTTRQEVRTNDDGISVTYNEISDPELPSYEEAYEYVSMS